MSGPSEGGGSGWVRLGGSALTPHPLRAPEGLSAWAGLRGDNGLRSLGRHRTGGGPSPSDPLTPVDPFEAQLLRSSRIESCSEDNPSHPLTEKSSV